MGEPNTDAGDSAPQNSIPQIPNGDQSSLVILAIDDDPGILGFYQAALGALGVQLVSSTDPKQALDLIAAHNPNLVILDLTMPEINGMDLLNQIKSRDPQTRVVMITGNYAIDTAIKAIQQGAIDYVCKPVSAEKLQELVSRVRTLLSQEERTRNLERELAHVSSLEGIVGHCPRMLEVFDLIRRVAPHFRTALVIGEPGSGRKAVARALHNLSLGQEHRFATFKSDVLPEKLAELQVAESPAALLSGAVVGERELLQSEMSGTVFLDEVGDLSSAAQLSLVRLLDQIEAGNQGAPVGIPQDLRVIASTSRDLQAQSQAGKFRADLWYRLSVVQIYLPPLRDRGDDVLLLARLFLTQFGARYGKAARHISRGAEAVLLAHSWPGNVDELESVMHRACMLTEGNLLDLGDLPAGLVLPGYGDEVLFRGTRGLSTSSGQTSSSTETLRQRVRDMLEP
jgi:DNA-binding NtrC family response regulator